MSEFNSERGSAGFELRPPELEGWLNLKPPAPGDDSDNGAASGAPPDEARRPWLWLHRSAEARRRSAWTLPLAVRSAPDSGHFQIVRLNWNATARGPQLEQLSNTSKKALPGLSSSRPLRVIVAQRQACVFGGPKFESGCIRARVGANVAVTLTVTRLGPGLLPGLTA